MNERIKKVRKALDLTQREFGLRIGLKPNSVTLIEKGRNTSEQTIFAICREFNVSETWLRTGEGEMFIPNPQTAIDEIVREHDLDDLDREIITEFIKLKPEDREAVKRYVRSIAQHVKTPDEQSQEYPDPKLTMEQEARAEAERYYEQLLSEKKRESQTSSARGSDVG